MAGPLRKPKPIIPSPCRANSYDVNNFNFNTEGKVGGHNDFSDCNMAGTKAGNDSCNLNVDDNKGQMDLNDLDHIPRAYDSRRDSCDVFAENQKERQEFEAFVYRMEHGLRSMNCGLRLMGKDEKRGLEIMNMATKVLRDDFDKDMNLPDDFVVGDDGELYEVVVCEE